MVSNFRQGWNSISSIFGDLIRGEEKNAKMPNGNCVFQIKETADINTFFPYQKKKDPYIGLTTVNRQ